MVLAALAAAALLLPANASAGVATAGAVLLYPFDPVPEIQFQHFGGYGCSYECGGGGYDRCGDGCGDHRRCHEGCYHRTRCGDGCERRERCDDGCRANCDDNCRPRCDGDCRRADCRDDCRPSCGDTCRPTDCHDGCRPPCNDGCTGAAVPCTERCSDTEHWEHDWRTGDHVGQEWYYRGRRERDIAPAGTAPHWYGHGPEMHDEDDEDAPPPAAAATPPADDHHDHDHHDH